MQESLDASLVRIRTPNGRVVGAGFLVGQRQVLTCAHVISQALGLPNTPVDPPQATLSLDFPLIPPRMLLTARVVQWCPPLSDGRGDIAGLELLGEPPATAEVVRFAPAEDLWEHPFRAFGFPAGYDDGVWATGRLLGRQATDWVMIEDVKAQGHPVAAGFSGTPVWDTRLQGVVGMVVAASSLTDLKTAFVLPLDVLATAWPQLRQQAIPSCPYRGLFAFREQDASYFFGREAFTQQLVDAVHRKPLVAVIGSSGSGKSSVVFAGLIPCLLHEGSWLTAAFRPGKEPFHSLAAALLPLLEPQMNRIDRLRESNKLAKQLQQGEISLQNILELIMQEQVGTRLLLVADQFEELYTLCRNQELREDFLDELLTAVRAMSGQQVLSCNLVLALRADFVGQALTYRPFADALQYTDLKLGPMNRNELQDAIRKPAEKLHVKVEDGLTERILKEVSHEPSHLPLLEFALTLLWAKQQDRKLTNAAYEEIGGLEQALARHADAIYEGLNEDEQQRTQRVFVQLVRPGEGTEDIRRLATRAEVGEDHWELVRYLSSWRARLVVTGRDPTIGEETCEVIHEALIRGWQRLQTWMEENREFRSWQERLREALRQWEKSGKDNGALLRGIPLVEAQQWLLQRREVIGPAEQEFIDASQRHKEEETQRWKTLYNKVFALVLLTNSLIIVVGATGGAWLAANLNNSPYATLTSLVTFIAIGCLLNVALNFILLRVALRPLSRTANS